MLSCSHERRAPKHISNESEAERGKQKLIAPARKILESAEQFKTERMKVVLGKNPESGNVYVLPAGSDDIEQERRRNPPDTGGVITTMLEKTALRLFLMCLVSCASLILFSFWVYKPDSETYFKGAATFFIVGLTSFLCWFVMLAYSLREALRGPSSVRG